MLKFIQCLLTLNCFLVSASMLQAQTFVFNTLESRNNCNPKFQLDIIIEIVGIKINNIYYDDARNNNGSFGFEILFKYKNIFTGSIPTSTNTFWAYNFTIKSQNNAIGSRNGISNNISNVPLRNSPEGILHSTSNNITYNGSASRLGFENGKIYDNPEILDMFNFSQFEISVNLPCMNANASGTKFDILLPIHLENWQAKTQQDGILLNWQIASTDNTEYFVIEKSNDAQQWQTLTSIDNSHRVYEYKDAQPFEAQNYYRLKAIDALGAITYSHIINAFFENTKLAEMRSYPNPAKDYIYIENLGDNALIQIIDLKGSIAFEYKNNATSNLRLDLPNLSTGIYMLSIISPNGQAFTQKISIME